MSKSLKFIIIFVVLLIAIFNCSYTFAAVNMNTTNTNTSNTNTSSTNTSNTNTSNTNTSSTSTPSTSNTSSSTLSSTVTTSDFDLELTNILCIALVVIGVLLILLGIAILIRLKR